MSRLFQPTVDDQSLPPPAPTGGGTGVRRAAGLALVAALGSLALVYFGGPLTARWQPPWPVVFPALSVRLDAVSALMGTLVSFLAWTVLRYSRQYVARDPVEAAYYPWLGRTFAAVLLLAYAGDLLVFLFAWVATSLCLHQLLRIHRHRPGGVFAARKKFVISRVGDFCLFAALLEVQRAYGTWDFEALFAATSAGNTAALPGICLWLAAGAALKSAQFPFHSWLPDTMETPTPVSAFMHAGIINAGGFLVIRLSPLFTHAPDALALLALAGTFTAAFGAVVMLTQPGVKRALAYSTIAQMGFMLLECGLGAFGLALLHLVAHSLYKAHAFLNSGSTVGAPARAAVPLRTPALLAGLGLAGAAVAVLLAGSEHPDPRDHLPGLVLGLSCAYAIARVWSATTRPAVLLGAAVSALLFFAVGSALHAAAFAAVPAGPSPATWVLTTCTGVFIALFAFQAVLWRMPRHRVGRALYVHALNGFYVGTCNNRLLRLLWPAPASR